MKNAVKLIVVVTLIAISLGAAEKRQKIKWDDVAGSDIIGNLGKPLGTVCKLEGIALTRRGVSKGDPDEMLCLDVKKIDGETPKTPMEIEAMLIAGLTEKPKAGETFSYLVYESGAFIGGKSDPNHLLSDRKDPELVPQTNDPNWNHYHLKVRLNIATKHD